MDWKIRYGDGSTFTNKQGTPRDAPVWDCQTVQEATGKEGVLRLHSKAYYWFDDDLGQWACGDFVGMLDFVLRTTSVKVGRNMRTEDFETLWTDVVNDPDFPSKSQRNYAREGPPLGDELP